MINLCKIVSQVMGSIHSVRKPLDNQQIIPLQFLRGIAASGVVIEHLLERYARRSALIDELPDFTSRLGQIGVATFFTISGFIMTYIALRDDGRSSSGAAFLRNRFLRVAPLYYLMTLFIVLFGLAARPFVTGPARRVPTLAELLLSFGFIPHRGANGVIQPIYELGWTLHYEMFFYLVFAVGLTVLKRKGVFFVLAALAALIAAGPYVDAPPETWGLRIASYVFTRPIMGYFAIGIIVALVRQRLGARLPSLPAPLAAGIALAALGIAAGSAERVVTMTAITAALAVTVLFNPKPAQGKAWFTKFSLEFGNASYSIYLTHSFLLGAFSSATARVARTGAAGLIAMTVLACLVCFVSGWLTWRLIELPITDRLRGRRSAVEQVAP